MNNCIWCHHHKGKGSSSGIGVGIGGGGCSSSVSNGGRLGVFGIGPSGDIFSSSSSSSTSSSSNQHQASSRLLRSSFANTIPTTTISSTGPANSYNNSYNSYYVGGMGTMGIMNQICEISDGLYLSGARAVNINRLLDLGITTVFNVTNELPNLYNEKIEYIKIGVEDSPYANLSYYFDKVADKVEQVRMNGGKCLIHCVAGISRSASLCIAYLIKYKKYSLRKGYNHVKARRHIIRPNPGFFRQLVDYEIKQLGMSSASMVYSSSAGCNIPDLYEDEYKNTMNFISKYGNSSHNSHSHSPSYHPRSHMTSTTRTSNSLLGSSSLWDRHR